MAELRVCVLEMGLSDASIERQDENTSSEMVHVTHSHDRGGLYILHSILHYIYIIYYIKYQILFLPISLLANHSIRPFQPICKIF
jgi:hypothetical protein